MNFEIFFYSLLVFNLSFLMKFFLIRKSTIDYDTFGHLYYIKELRIQGRSAWKKLKIQSWNGRDVFHPFFLHSILSYFNTSYLYKNQKFINLLLDSLFSVYIFNTAIGQFNDLKLATTSVLIYTFTPIWFSKISMGPRIANFTPRLFSEIIFNILICTILGFHNFNLTSFYIATILLTSIILLTSKFGLQVVLFVLPLTSLITKNLYPLVLILFSFLFTIIISKGTIINLFTDQFNHLKNYYISNLKGNTSISSRNKIISFKINDLFTFNGIRKIIYNFLFYNSYTVLLFKMPLLIILLIGFFKYHFLLSSFFFNINLFIISVTILFFIISLKLFLFLGEAERYLNHIAILIIFSLIYLIKLTDATWLIYSLILYGIIYYFIEIFIYDKFLFAKDKEPADMEIEIFLKSFKESRTVLSYPYHNFNIWRLMLNTQHKPIMPTLMSSNYMNIFLSKYDIKSTFLDLNKLDEIINLTDCSIILIYNNSLLNDHLKYKEILFYGGWLEKNLQNKIYSVYYKV